MNRQQRKTVHTDMNSMMISLQHNNLILRPNLKWLGESHEGSPFSHLNNNLLHLHMMNSTMNRQQRKTVHTDMNSMMISLQHNNLILRPNLKPKTTSHSQNRSTPLPEASTPP